MRVLHALSENQHWDRLHRENQKVVAELATAALIEHEIRVLVARNHLRGLARAMGQPVPRPRADG